MQPNAIGITADLVDFFTKELRQRKKEKAAEFEQLEEHTRNILKRLDVELPAKGQTEKIERLGFYETHLIMMQLTSSKRYIWES